MKLSEVHEVKRKEIKRRFNVPNEDVEVDEFFRPFERINGAKMMCTLRRTAIVGQGFHQHELKNSK